LELGLKKKFYFFDFVKLPGLPLLPRLTLSK